MSRCSTSVATRLARVSVLGERADTSRSSQSRGDITVPGSDRSCSLDRPSVRELVGWFWMTLGQLGSAIRRRPSSVAESPTCRADRLFSITRIAFLGRRRSCRTTSHRRGNMRPIRVTILGLAQQVLVGIATAHRGSPPRCWRLSMSKTVAIFSADLRPAPVRTTTVVSSGRDGPVGEEVIEGGGGDAAGGLGVEAPRGELAYGRADLVLGDNCGGTVRATDRFHRLGEPDGVGDGCAFSDRRDTLPAALRIDAVERVDDGGPVLGLTDQEPRDGGRSGRRRAAR